MQVKLEEGKTYKIRADIGAGEQWYTAIRRKNDDGKDCLYYIEDDFEDYYYEDDPWDSDDVKELS